MMDLISVERQSKRDEEEIEELHEEDEENVDEIRLRNSTRRSS